MHTVAHIAVARQAQGSVSGAHGVYGGIGPFAPHKGNPGEAAGCARLHRQAVDQARGKGSLRDGPFSLQHPLFQGREALAVHPRIFFAERAHRAAVQKQKHIKRKPGV